jgi:hypothetical protein
MIPGTACGPLFSVGVLLSHPLRDWSRPAPSDNFGSPLAPLSGVINARRQMSSFGTYLLGFIILIIGLSIGAYLLNVPTTWIVVGAVVLIGIGVLTATTRTKMRDPADGSTRPPSSPTG